MRVVTVERGGVTGSLMLVKRTSGTILSIVSFDIHKVMS